MTKINGLLATDVDSAFTQEEGIDLLGEEAGVGGKVTDTTARATNGELDSKQVLNERIGLLKDLPGSTFDKVLARMHFTNGAEKLVVESHRRGYKVAAVSGGFHETVDVLAERIGLDYVKASRLEIKDDVLAGKVPSEVVAKDIRKASLIEWAAKNGLELSQTVAMGDGANNLPMIKTTGIGIAFRAKPVVRKEASYQTNEADLYKAIDISDGKS